MANYDDRLKDYVDVKERIRLFYEKHPDGRLVTAKVKLTGEPDRVWVKALAYRTPDDPLPGTGWSWMLLPGTTPYTRGSEIENAETSAWGRAIGSLGIGIEKSIASADEVRNKEGEPEAPVTRGGETLEYLGNLTKAGHIVKGTASAYKLEWRETPDGWAIGFRLRLPDKPDKDMPQVLVTGAMGAALHLAYPDGAALDGLHVTIKGRLHGVKAPGRAGYYRLVLGEGASDRIETPDVRIPPSEPPADVEAQPEVRPEAESMTLPLDAEERELVGGGLPDA